MALWAGRHGDRHPDAIGPPRESCVGSDKSVRWCSGILSKMSIDVPTIESGAIPGESLIDWRSAMDLRFAESIVKVARSHVMPPTGKASNMRSKEGASRLSPGEERGIIGQVAIVGMLNSTEPIGVVHSIENCIDTLNGPELRRVAAQDGGRIPPARPGVRRLLPGGRRSAPRSSPGPSRSMSGAG